VREIRVATRRDVPALFVIRAFDEAASRLEVHANTGHRHEVAREP
jgi:hypothetical protein